MSVKDGTHHLQSTNNCPLLISTRFCRQRHKLIQHRRTCIHQARHREYQEGLHIRAQSERSYSMATEHLVSQGICQFILCKITSVVWQELRRRYAQEVSINMFTGRSQLLKHVLPTPPAFLGIFWLLTSERCFGKTAFRLLRSLE